MIRTIAAACLLAAITGSALAGAPATTPVDSCPMLTASRAQVRTFASANGFTVRNLHGDAVGAWAKDPAVIRNTSANQLSQLVAAKHVTVIMGTLPERFAVLMTTQACGYLEDVLMLSQPIALPTAAVPFLNGQF